MLQMTVALVLFLFPLAYSPGPGNMIFAATSARFGFRATVPASIGYHVATWIVTAAIGLGAIAALDQYRQAFSVLKVAGSLYVLWMAWNLLKAGKLAANAPAKAATFTDGVVLLVLNPKAYVIIALMFTQFLGHPEMGTLATVVLITTVFTVNNLVAFSVWSLAGDQIARCFRTPESAQKLNFVFGGILAAVAIWMLLS